jgi:hypothetical protein
MATRKSNIKKRARQRRRHDPRPQPQQYSPLSRGVLVQAQAPSPLAQVLAERNQ